MTKMSSMNPESFLMAGSLNNVTKDRRLMAGASRVEKLLGFNPSSQNSTSDAGDLNELKEEDVWGTWPDGGSNPAHETKKEENFRHKTDSGVETGRILQNGRRWLGLEREVGGLSVAFEESNRSRLSPLNRTSNTFNGAPPSRMSVRMIPQIGSSGDIGNRHMMLQSAPVNVPDWSKILGMDQREDNPNYISAVDEEDDGEQLPPHEYLAREQARSQMATTSVFEGVGRTLKGRDMSRVRNAVWRQTGFLG